MDNQIQKANSQVNNSVAIFKEQLEIAEEIAKAIMNSNFADAFKVKLPDPNDPEKQIVGVKKEDIISCILLGRELGLNDMTSITFGKTLDKTAYFKVMKGKSLGLDAVSSLQHIFCYEKDGNMVVGMDGNSVNALAIKAGVTYSYIEDFVVKKYYRDLKNVFLSYTFESNYILITKNTSPVEAQKALEEGKIPVKECSTFSTTVEFERKGWKPYRETYTLLDATEAGLYKGIDFVGNEVKGKPAWNSNPKRVLMTRTLSIGNARIAGDALNGLLPLEELNEIRNIDNEIPITPSEEVK